MEAVGGAAETCATPSNRPEPSTTASVFLTDIIDVSSLGQSLDVQQQPVLFLERSIDDNDYHVRQSILALPPNKTGY
jgi:hypothetical protein